MRSSYNHSIYFWIASLCSNSSTGFTRRWKFYKFADKSGKRFRHKISLIWDFSRCTRYISSSVKLSDFVSRKMASLSIDDVKVQLQKFGFFDYSMFVFMLAICAVIGIYFGFFEKKSKHVADETDYLVGGRNMKVFPVAMSLIARY